MRVRKLCCFDYLFFGRSGFAVAYVFKHGSCKKINILLNDSDVIPEALKLDITNVFTVDLNVAVGYVIESRDEAAERCLTASGRTYKSNIRTCFDIKIDMTQYPVRSVLILERYVFK